MVRSEKEIRENLADILESRCKLGKRMEGYVKALKWVLEEL